ncbi:MAG TPA: helix-turn-helix domain-containing protein [Candidatus Nitrosopolaris sp.]|nr:helix-turn-helix domain-containing protein [Candidatus Nitrosopolaris sp.]
MAININNVEEFLTSELKLSKEESKTFLFIVKNGRRHLDKIAESLKLSENEGKQVANSLVEKGMIINISQSEYESLHPRFAISNRYRRLCEEDNIPFRKNLMIDNIGIVLESAFEDARTK